MTAQQTERFLAKVNILTDDECWPWIGGMTGKSRRGGKDVRGAACIARKVMTAHRAAWLLENGPIPPGMCVLHHCDNTLCCNPAHLFLGTQQDNIADMVRKGRNRNAFYEASGQGKLTREQIAEVRELYQAGELRSGEIATRYGINRTHVWRIGTGVHPPQRKQP